MFKPPLSVCIVCTSLFFKTPLCCGGVVDCTGLTQLIWGKSDTVSRNPTQGSITTTPTSNKKNKGKGE